MPNHIQVHRFRDNVAASLGTGPTVYMAPDDATAFALALLKAAQSCRTETFAKSTCGTFQATIADPRNGE